MHITLGIILTEDSADIERRRTLILNGIAQDQKYSDIANDIGVSRWVVIKEVGKMRYNSDPALKKAKKKQKKIRQEKNEDINSKKIHVQHNNKFLESTGITLEEKTFRNMVEFYQVELMNVVESPDQKSVINSLPKNVRKTMIRNKIVTDNWHTHKLTPKATKYLDMLMNGE
jgi:hypothetical protein